MRELLGKFELILDGSQFAETEHLISRIVIATGLRNMSSNSGIKAQKRRVWTLLLPEFDDPRFVDLSVMSPI